MKTKKTIMFILLLISIHLANSQTQENNIKKLVLNYIKQNKDLKKENTEIILSFEKNVIINPIQTDSLINQILPTTKKFANHELEVNLMRIKGAAMFYQGKFLLAENISDKAMELAKRYKIEGAMPRILATKGNAQIYQSKLTEGLETQNKGLKIAEKIKDKHAIHLMKNNLVAIHLQFNDFEIAKQYLEDNINYYKNIPGASNVLATSYNNLALVYEKQKDYKKSIIYLQKALNQKGVENNKILLSQIYNNLGNGFNKTNNLDSTFYYFKKAFETNSVTNNVKSQAASKIGLSDYYYKIKQYEKSKKLAQEAYNMGIKINSVDVQKESSDQLFKAYSYLNKIDSAMYYHNIMSKLTDSIVNQDNTRKTTKMFMEYEFTKKEEDYKHKEAIQQLNLQKHLLQNLINKEQLDKSLQEQELQLIALENQKLINSENSQKLKFETQNKIIAQNENKSLQQKNELTELKLKQFWLYTLVGFIIIGILAYMFWNKSRINKLKFEKDLKEKESKELLHKNKATESELKAIRSQMNPHFIFNVLNSIESYIVEHDANNAQDLIQKFAKLSRLILENSTQTLASLESEWQINKLYVEIEHLRFDKQFTYEFENLLKDKIKQFVIPPMMIQPLVENAVLHGIRNQTTKDAKLKVVVKEKNNNIEILVIDNGPGLKKITPNKPSYKKKSFGLSSVKDRIAIINETNINYNADFKIIDREIFNEKGCITTLILPKIKAESIEFE